MDALCDAIEGRWAGASGAAIRALCNGLHFGVAPDRVADPHVRYHIISNDLEHEFGLRETDEVVIQFSVFSRSVDRQEAANIGEALFTLFDFCAMTISGWALVQMARESAVLEGTENNWHYAIRYRVLIQKNA